MCTEFIRSRVRSARVSSITASSCCFARRYGFDNRPTQSINERGKCFSYKCTYGILLLFSFYSVLVVFFYHFVVESTINNLLRRRALVSETFVRRQSVFFACTPPRIRMFCLYKVHTDRQQRCKVASLDRRIR